MKHTPITNNGDRIKVLLTVASTVYAFLNQHPDCYILATGSTKSRNRLYRMGITNNLIEISENFIIKGLTKKGGWVKFEVGGNYEAFMIYKNN